MAEAEPGSAFVIQLGRVTRPQVNLPAAILGNRRETGARQILHDHLAARPGLGNYLHAAPARSAAFVTGHMRISNYPTGERRDATHRALTTTTYEVKALVLAKWLVSKRLLDTREKAGHGFHIGVCVVS